MHVALSQTGELAHTSSLSWATACTSRAQGLLSVGRASKDGVAILDREGASRNIRKRDFELPEAVKLL